MVEGTRPGAEEAHDAPAGEIPAEEAHEAPAGEVPASTETPVAPDEIELLDADDLVPHDVEIPKKQKIHQVGPVDAKFQLIWVEPGSYIMGSPEDESGRAFNENQHQVTLTQGYYLGKYEVTVAQYKWVMGASRKTTLTRGIISRSAEPIGTMPWPFAKS